MNLLWWIATSVFVICVFCIGLFFDRKCFLKKISDDEKSKSTTNKI